MRLIINGTPGPVILHNGYRIPQAFGGSIFDPAFLWPERTVPRTEKPVRFAPAKFAYWYARWHMRPVYCRQSPLPRIGESVIYRDA